MQPLLHVAHRSVEMGIYRDGDNNLDDSQTQVLEQARAVSAQDSRVQFTVEDTSHSDEDNACTQTYDLSDGRTTDWRIAPKAVDMAAEKTLAAFVARTLDDAEKCDAQQTWITLVDHGAGDGGGLEADSFRRQIMPMPDMARAIRDGVAMHAKAHPEDAQRRVDGVVANQCLMASLGFADALSHVGVQYLAASPETMVSPGVPSTIAHDIAEHQSDTRAMASAIVKDTMQTKYGVGPFSYGPAAAFDVIDTSRDAFAPVERAVCAFNDALSQAHSGDVAAVRQDATRIDGMARFPEATDDMPWHADRPAEAVYGAIADDARVSDEVRNAAAAAAKAVKSIVLAHGESAGFVPFGGASYKDAAGPTVHFPVTPSQIDPWAPKISETQNRFFAETHAAAAEKVVA